MFKNKLSANTSFLTGRSSEATSKVVTSVYVLVAVGALALDPSLIDAFSCGTSTKKSTRPPEVTLVHADEMCS